MSILRIAAGAGEITLTVATASHVGLVRLVNEDSLLAESPMFAVADGMGGHAFGDRASAAAVRALREELAPGGPTEPAEVLAAIRRANSAVRELTAGVGDDRVIAGTTLTGVALVLEHPQDHDAEALPRWMVFNLGDSRVYRWGAGGTVAAGAASAAGPRLERVSVDHSIVQELFDAGVIDEERTRTHPDRNIITRALGASDRVEPEAWLLPAAQPQTFLICSDGLTKELDDERIAAVLRSASDPQAAVDQLLLAALEAGGHDNITIVLVRSAYRRRGVAGGDSAVEDGAREGVDEQTRDRPLSPELEDTLPRL
jgi:serine/threonine protein phosphatase PrpC